MTQPPHDIDAPQPDAETATPAESPVPTAVQKARAERAARLASALRDNLRRRKAPRPAAPARDRN